MASGAVGDGFDDAGAGSGSALAMLGAVALGSAEAIAASGTGALSAVVTSAGDFGGGVAQPVRPEEGGAPPTINAVAASAYG